MPTVAVRDLHFPVEGEESEAHRMADEVDYESDSAMAMEEEEEEQKRDVKIISGDRNASRRVELSTSSASKSNSGRRVVKGRGRGSAAMDTERYPDEKGVFEKLKEPASARSHDHSNAIQSVEGWILIVTGVHEEAQEENLLDAFGETAPVKNLHMNLDRRSGFVKGYALIEFEEYEAAKEAIERMDGEEILGQRIRVDWAFRKEAGGERGRGGRSGRR